MSDKSYEMLSNEIAEKIRNKATSPEFDFLFASLERVTGLLSELECRVIKTESCLGIEKC